MYWEELLQVLYQYRKSTSPVRVKTTIGVFTFVFIILCWFWSGLRLFSAPSSLARPLESTHSASEYLVETIESLSQYFVDFPLNDAQFGEMGRRAEILGDWLKKSNDASSSLTSAQKESLVNQTERLAHSLFPFLPADRSLLVPGPSSFVPETSGIIIPTGRKSFRYACHLVSCIREVLHSNLPIQIAYAGDNDLPLAYREMILALTDGIEMLDISTIFEDNDLAFSENGWAVKPFAVLASKFQHVLLLDADAVFLQPPETIFGSRGYHETGTYLFHDRLLWKGAFEERHQWWREQMKHRSPSETLLKSLVWTEDYAEEGDSGVVAVDKGRIPVLVGLLHICWQNTKTVRERWTYRLTFGDKESWWFGFELTGVPYAFEAHYASLLGATIRQKDDDDELCGFTIAHVDEALKLLWYNGSLLKNKLTDPMEFDIPTNWMIDGIWWKSASRTEMSCMSGTLLRAMDETEAKVLEENVRVAKRVDQRLAGAFPKIWGHLDISSAIEDAG